MKRPDKFTIVIVCIALLALAIPALAFLSDLHERINSNDPLYLKKGFPVNDDSVHYSIHCWKTYSIKYEPHKENAINFIGISNAPTNLEAFCGKEVDIQFSIRPEKALPICRDRNFGSQQSYPHVCDMSQPVADITSISLKE
jgi:hypothetical protein